MTRKDIKARAKSQIEVIKARTAERERYNAERAKEKQARAEQRAKEREAKAPEREKEKQAKAQERADKAFSKTFERAGIRRAKEAVRERAKEASQRERAEKVRAREAGIIEKARLKRLNPTAFASENAPVFDATGQVARESPEELDAKQRRETVRALGRMAYSSEPKNFVVEKPLAPNALDLYQAQKMQQRASVRNERAFAPVQKL